MRCNVTEMEASSQIRPECYVDGKDTSDAENYPCEVDPPILEDVCTAVRNNRAPEEVGIPTEVYKACLDSLGPWLHRVITKVWLCEAVPKNWSEAVLRPLFKNGDKRICSNYIGISLIVAATKVVGVILLKRVQSKRDQRTLL